MQLGKGLFAAAACGALLACGGGGTTAPPAPSPGPSPAPTPTPMPNPGPTPAPTPGPIPTGSPNLAGARDGATLRLQRACTTAAITYSGSRVTGLQSIVPATLSATTIVYTALPPDRLAYEGEEHFFANLTPDFGFYESISNFPLAVASTALFSAPTVTFGNGARGGLCFFAAGLPATVPTGNLTYDGTVDGLAQSAAGTRRLIRSSADVTMNFTAGTGTVSLVLKTLPDAFAPSSGQLQTTLGTLTGNLTLNGTQVTVSNIAAPSGYTGTMQGELVGTAGMALAFQLRNGAGDVIWGAVAVDGSAGRAAWDY